VPTCITIDVFDPFHSRCLFVHTKYSRQNSAGGKCENLNVLSGHKNAILDVCFTNDSEKIITASADYNLGVFDVITGERIKRFMGHNGIVNAVDVSSEG
jgi:Prp8 binding protein